MESLLNSKGLFKDIDKEIIEEFYRIHFACYKGWTKTLFKVLKIKSCL